MENKKGNNRIWGVLFILSGIGIWGYQIYYWLRYAEWSSFSLLWPLSFYSQFQDWVYYPYDWVGFHNVLDFIPLSIILILIGVFAIDFISED